METFFVIGFLVSDRWINLEIIVVGFMKFGPHLQSGDAGVPEIEGGVTPREYVYTHDVRAFTKTSTLQGG
jgi:hypothetical protein